MRIRGLFAGESMFHSVTNASKVALWAAVHTLVRWYQAGDDVAALLPRLSTYLGHLTPGYTYWYLSAAPELLALAAGRLQDADRRRAR